MHDKNITIHLLEYYSNLSMHHRVMMLGFLTVYFGGSQALLLTPLATVQAGPAKDAVTFLVSAGLVITFLLAAAMHHACHFCATAGMKAIMAADMHYQHLPQSKTDDPFVNWISRSAMKAREALAVRSFSIYVLGLLFIGVYISCEIVFFSVATELLDKKPMSGVFIFCIFLVLRLLSLAFYGITFAKHYLYFQIAKRELQLVLMADSRNAVVRKIGALKGGEPDATTWSQFLTFHRSEPPE